MRLTRTHLSQQALAPPTEKTIHISAKGNANPHNTKYNGRGDSIFFETDAPAIVIFDNEAVFGTGLEYLRPEDNPTEFTTDSEMQSTTFRVFVAPLEKTDPPKIVPGG